MTPSHWACVSSHLPIVRLLVVGATGGVNVEARAKRGVTPLHLVSCNRFVSIVRYLVEHGQANVNAKDNRGFTPLDMAICKKGMLYRETTDIVRYLLPRTSSIADEALVKLLKLRKLADIRGIVLEKYALGRGLANAFHDYPIHTILKEFPLKSAKTFRESIKLFPSSAFSLLDEDDRLSLHVALSTTVSPRNVASVKSPSVISLLFEREPRSALARDPTTGLFPHEIVAAIVSNDFDSSCDDDNGNDPENYCSSWLDVVYKMLRSNPQRLLQHHRSSSFVRSRKKRPKRRSYPPPRNE